MKILPNYKDDEDVKYTGPDVYELLTTVDCLKQNLKITRCWSELGSGCYQPYRSQEGLNEHNLILEEIYKIIKK